EDVLSFVNQNGITGSYDATTGVLTLAGSATVANYQAALRSVTYTDTSDAPNTSNRTINFGAFDGTDFSTAATKMVSVGGVDDVPVITSNGGGPTASAAVPENTTSVTTVTADDPDGPLPLTFSLVGGADQARFQIDAMTGALAFISAPDFEHPTDVD